MRGALRSLTFRGVIVAAGVAGAALAGASSASAAGCAASSPYAAAVTGTSGVVSYWRLGEASGTSACDAVGTNTGTYQGGYTMGQNGALNGDPDTAVAFNGSSGLATVPHSASLDMADKFTLEAWVKRGLIGGPGHQAVAPPPAQP